MSETYGYQKWKRRVDHLVNEAVGISTDDLPDFPFMDYYEDGTSPENTVAEILTENGLEQMEE